MHTYETQEARTKFASMLQFDMNKRKLRSLINKFKRTEGKHEQEDTNTTDSEEVAGQTTEE